MAVSRRTVHASAGGPIPIAVFMPTFERGGTELQTVELIRRLDPQRWRVHLACLRAGGPLFSRAADSAASVADFPTHSLRSVEGLRQLRRFAAWCVAKRIAVVHATALPGNLFALPGAWLARVPLRVGSRRGFDLDKPRGHVLAQRGAFVLAHTIVVNSEAVARRLIAERVPARRLAVIPNGVELPALPVRRSTGSSPRIVVIASLRPVKAHDVLIDAAPGVLRRFPHARFELLGSGPLEATVRASIASRGLSHAFLLAGHCPDVMARLAEADVCVLPSRSEGLPNALLEAMAAGVPVVATDVGGTAELVQHDRTGWLVAPGDATALAAGICAVLEDSAAAGRRAAAARAIVEAQHGWPRVIAAYEGLYLRGLGYAAPEQSISLFRQDVK